MLAPWEPGVRRESFIQGVKIANLCGKNAAADPFLSREAVLCPKEDPWTTGGITVLRERFCRVYFFPVTVMEFFLFSEIRSTKSKPLMWRLADGMSESTVSGVGVLISLHVGHGSFEVLQNVLPHFGRYAVMCLVWQIG